MLPAVVKSKAALILIAAAVASSGTIAGILLMRPHTAAEASAVPLPSAPPGSTPGAIDAANAQALTAATPVSYPAAPAPTPDNIPTAPGYVPVPTPAPDQSAQAQIGLSPDQLDQLLGPIALYPDPLIAEILPASTYPDELAAAALWLRGNESPPDAAIDAQPWEPPVKALAHSPSVLIWMYNNPDWTRTLGTAFTYQQADVMNAIQSLRAMAMASGTLVDTPQQLVVMQGPTICIEPATTDVLYVPVYDWRVCYTRRYEPTFFAGCHFGAWLDDDCDWDDHFITVGARWDLGWDHRWDHDGAAHPVIVRNARDRMTVDPRVPANRTVNIGGSPWRRNESRPAPTLPASVRPAARPEARPAQAPPHQVITPRPENPHQETLPPNREPTVVPERRPAVVPGDRGTPPEGRGIAPKVPEGRGPTPPARGGDGRSNDGRGRGDNRG